VVVDGSTLLVSRFRSAQVLTLDADGHELQRLTPPSFRSSDTHGGSVFSAGVAWRMVEMPGGGAAMIHQRGMEDAVPTQPGGYGSRNPCDAIVHSAMTVMKSGMAMPSTPALVGMVLPTDMAVSADGKRVAVIASGNGSNASVPSLPPALPRVFVTDIDAATDPTTGCNPDGRHAPCVPSGFETGGSSGSGGSPGSSGGSPGSSGGSPGSGGAVGTGGVGTGGGLGTGGFVAEANGGSAGTSSLGGAGGIIGGAAGAPSVVVGGTATGGAQVDTCASSRPEGGAPDVRGEPIAVAFDGTGRVVVQTREPSALFVVAGGAAGTASISLSSVSRADTGHAIFHGNAGGMIACASCHPEGTEDGRVWNFSCEGPRRTQSLGGGLAGTEPFHWNGELPAFPALMTGVFVGRMSGPALASDQVDAAFSWINRQPRVPVAPPSDPQAAARGRAIFQDGTRTACSTCHAGDKLTNNQTVDVGTGGLFQVPSLVGVSARPPFMHDGCAKTLADRFTPTCGGGDRHGVTSTLSPAQLADLIAYLETL
jgi:mono/diheme cytochrome c family protein